MSQGSCDVPDEKASKEPLRRDSLVGLVAILVAILVPVVVFAPLRDPAAPSDPWSHVPEKPGLAYHTAL